jgi:hypothetical protein
MASLSRCFCRALIACFLCTAFDVARDFLAGSLTTEAAITAAAGKHRARGRGRVPSTSTSPSSVVASGLVFSFELPDRSVVKPDTLEPFQGPAVHQHTLLVPLLLPLRSMAMAMYWVLGHPSMTFKRRTTVVVKNSTNDSITKESLPTNVEF